MNKILFLTLLFLHFLGWSNILFGADGANTPFCFGENWRSCHQQLDEKRILGDLKKETGKLLGSDLQVIATITDQYDPFNFTRLFLISDKDGAVTYIGMVNEYNRVSLNRATQEKHLWPIEELKRGIVIQSEKVPLLGYKDLVRLKAIAMDLKNSARLRLSFSPNVAIGGEKDFINVELKAFRQRVGDRERWVLWGVKDVVGGDENKWPWIPVDIIDFQLNRVLSLTAIGLKDVIITCLAIIPNSNCGR